MDIRIGVTYTQREIELQLAEDADRDELRTRIEDALADDDKVLWLTDRKGREVGIPSGKIAFVEIGGDQDARPMGFSS